ncbi:TIGR02530 family flagellar biosynthesis protein [Lysinibacillus irui]|uniref:TIGR02530 family flagellar biosynthesis protein n=1 Tax=Lysinibacillus irui TaxID=2998077 RepID=A0ABU5NJS4_9BACI|nr:TIGR02530 family flagellar biosynthesis protein [Lysinibacillus irui]MEA0554451.1 TIGR02530 family flagellar biosynthesis protein [Lysinibacillus irui]MEA0564711.1 TIGR02530 family flagellar biosynthesis protein [Lysinibacillus irui]MEA0976293.1 TIGR02530 family flagellar biosynthesis protein [Lysinibacillus irui]MEA1042447.1 TIGR02530 family flagellar biosynthesis protein [Lysinibacillus irui]
MDKFSIHRVPLHPSIRTTQPTSLNTQHSSFKAHLQEAAKQELKVSKHAHERMMERKIDISEQEWQVVSDKVFEARSKGVKQPLVLMDQAALIISAKNATVITAMDRTEAKQQLFTNIDGTIVL